MAFKDARKGRGLYRAEVVRRSRVSPHVVRLTLGGGDLAGFPRHGYDHWFRLFVPRADGPTDFSHLPEQFGMAGYVKYLTTPAGERPVVRNYTVREHREAAGEVDVDFVVHGEDGVAGPWAARAEPGERVALLDQGRGFDLLDDADFHVLAGDESALPAIAGILRDLPRDAQGLALIEVPEAADAQPLDPPSGFEIRWLARTDGGVAPGVTALEALRGFVPENPATLSAYVVGEQALAAEGRRHLVSLGVPKARIAFVGYWRIGKPS